MVISYNPVSNIVISYSYRGFEVFLKVSVIIIFIFDVNNVSWQIYIDIINLAGGRGGHTWLILHFSFVTL